VAISRAEQQRVATKGVLFSVPVFVVAILLTVAFGEDLISGARDWPGGPSGFLVTLGFLSAGSLLLVALACLVYAWPERTPPRLRISARARFALAVGGGLVAILTAVPLASTLPLRQGQPSDCDPSGFGCAMRAEHASAVVSGWLTFIVVCCACSALLFTLFRPGSALRKTA
jgi:hypothetical protein